MPGQVLGRVDGRLQAAQRRLVDDRAHEGLVPGDVADLEGLDGVGEPALQLLPQAPRQVGARRRRALLPLVLERTPHQRHEQGVGVGRGVRDDGVLAAGLTDDARVVAVPVDVVPDLLPQVAEHRGRSGEADTGEVLVGQRPAGDVRPGAVHEVDHAGRQAGLLEDPHDHVVAERGLLRRLPDHRVAHQRRRGREVAADRGEVERGDRQDEALQAALVEVVELPGRRRGLGLVDLGGEVGVVAEEVGQLAGGVDLGLVEGLRLTEHGRRQELVAVLAAHELGGAQQHGRPVPPRGPRPVGAGGEGGPDRGVDLAGVGGGVAAEHVGVIVRSDDVDGRTERQALPVDHVAQLADLAADAVELGVQGDGLGRARAVVADGLVHRCGDAEVAGDGQRMADS